MYSYMQWIIQLKSWFSLQKREGFGKWTIVEIYWMPGPGRGTFVGYHCFYMNLLEFNVVIEYKSAGLGSAWTSLSTLSTSEKMQGSV